MAVKFERVAEKIFTGEHPEVISWTAKFDARCREHRIFDRFEAAVPGPSFEKAVAVGTQWLRFSEVMPWVLCRAAAEMESNRKRHYVIQGAFEELGLRVETDVHAEMFRAATEIVGIDDSHHRAHSHARRVSSALKLLRNAVTSARFDSEVLGLLLGLEICAHENVETVFGALAHSRSLEGALSRTQFFTIHRVIESEHIRLAVANFLRFCETDADRRRFSKGFETGVGFWVRFWQGAADVARAEKGRARASR